MVLIVNIVFSELRYDDFGFIIIKNIKEIITLTEENKKFYHTYDCHTRKKLVDKLVALIKSIQKEYSKIIVVCIGNNKNIDDLYGPLIGQMLKRTRSLSFDVVGTLSRPVKASALPETIPEKTRSESLIIAIDACVCEDNNEVGGIEIRLGSVFPGSAYGKGEPPIGDISINGVMIRREKPYPNFLSESMPGMVFDMADKTACIIKDALKQIAVPAFSDVIT
jgi:putative sporulation protein YyaC